MTQQTISLVLPCRNEEKALRQLLSSILKSTIFEVVVVDNSSIDKTSVIAHSMGAKILTESRHKNGIGYGYALATGIKAVLGDIVVCMDGDGSYPTNVIPEIVSYLTRHGLDFISCNRLPVQQPKKMSSIRMLGVRILNFFIWLLFGYTIKDSLSGMWVFKKSSIKYLSLFEGDWNFSLEIKLNAITNPNIKFAEYHIPYHDRELNASKQKIFKTGLNHLLFLFKKRFFYLHRPFPLSKISLLEG